MNEIKVSFHSVIAFSKDFQKIRKQKRTTISISAVIEHNDSSQMILLTWPLGVKVTLVGHWFHYFVSLSSLRIVSMFYRSR